MTEADVDPDTGLSVGVAPPRDNGELVFTAPWQSRLFATTMALRERGLLAWEPFRQALIAHIADHTGSLTSADAYDYWGCWQAALEERLADTGLVAAATLDGRSAELATRPGGHDHPHRGHGHPHLDDG
ncbi:MAG: nitrile hydratase accessory protein [Actinomycetota bacterium]